MKKIKYLIFSMLILFVAFGCEKLDVENTNQPDFIQTLQYPNSVKGVAGGLLNQWFVNVHVDEGPSLAMYTMADAGTCSWGNFGMRDMSSEPRVVFNNTPSYPNAPICENYYKLMYSTLSSANDVLKRTVVDGLEMNTEEETSLVNAVAYFVQGLSQGYIGLVYDKAFIVDESTDFNVEEVLASPYNDVIAKAVSSLDKCIAICESNSFTIPTDWLPTASAYTNVELGKLANSFAARLLAYAPRNASENATADWAKILTYANKGINIDFAPMADADPYEDGKWYMLDLYYGIIWLRTDMRVVHYMDINTPSRWPKNATLVAESTSPDARLTSDFEYMASQEFRPERGDYHFSSYRYSRYDAYADFYNTPLVDFKVAENDLIKAEALVFTGDLPGAAAVINAGTRVTRGGLTGVDVVKQEIMDAIEYETFVELPLTGMGTQFFRMRKLDLLQPGTLLHFPIPAQQLEVMQLPFYSFGGSTGVAGVDYSNGGWEN